MINKKSDSILITGGSGFIGRNLVKFLLKSNFKIFYPNRYTLNLYNKKTVFDYVKLLRPKYVIHLACTSCHPKDSNNIDLVSGDLNMINNLILAMDEGTKLIIAGSVSEYGHTGILSESLICTPDTYYGLAKFNTNLTATMLCKRKNIDLLHLRIFGAYGYGEAEHRLFPSLLASIKRHEDFHMSDGLQIRDFTHVGDICTTFKKILLKKIFPTGILNLGTGIGLKVIDVCKKILIESKLNGEVRLIHSKERNFTDKDILISNSKSFIQIVGSTPPQRLNQDKILKLFDENYFENF
jgi:nucleoside-diphosphate-sugar epimerase